MVRVLSGSSNPSVGLRRRLAMPVVARRLLRLRMVQPVGDPEGGEGGPHLPGHTGAEANRRRRQLEGVVVHRDNHKRSRRPAAKDVLKKRRVAGYRRASAYW